MWLRPRGPRWGLTQGRGLGEGGGPGRGAPGPPGSHAGRPRTPQPRRQPGAGAARGGGCRGCGRPDLSPPSPPVTPPPPCPAPQTFLFYLYGLLLRETTCEELVKKHLAGLLELSHQLSSQREVGRRPWGPRPCRRVASLHSSASAGATGAGADLQRPRARPHRVVAASWPGDPGRRALLPAFAGPREGRAGVSGASRPRRVLPPLWTASRGPRPAGHRAGHRRHIGLAHGGGLGHDGAPGPHPVPEVWLCVLRRPGREGG